MRSCPGSPWPRQPDSSECASERTGLFSSCERWVSFFSHLFIPFWLRLVLVATCGIFCWGAWASLAVAGPHCAWTLVSSTQTLVEARELGCPVACGIWVLWPGMKLASCALQGRFLITGPPEKEFKQSQTGNLNRYLFAGSLHEFSHAKYLGGVLSNNHFSET